MAFTLPHGAEYLERTEVGLPLVVTNNDRITKRRPLALRLLFILVHYTGVTSRKYHGIGRAELIKVIHSINNWKRNEYNYVIAWDGTIVEFAGRFEAIHCATWLQWSSRHWNRESYGVLFLNAVGEPVTRAQLDSFVWMKNVLRWGQQVAQDVRVEPHSFARPTGCPGPSIGGPDALAWMRAA